MAYELEFFVCERAISEDVVEVYVGVYDVAHRFLNAFLYGQYEPCPRRDRAPGIDDRDTALSFDESDVCAVAARGVLEICVVATVQKDSRRDFFQHEIAGRRSTGQPRTAQ